MVDPPFKKLQKLQVAPKDKLVGNERGLAPVRRADFPVVPPDDPTLLGTQLSTQLGTKAAPKSPSVYPTVYPSVYPPGVPNRVDNALPNASTQRRYRDTRAQLNLKIPLEKMFKLRQWCEQTGASQRQAIEDAIDLLCDSLGTQSRVDKMGSSVDLIDDRENLSIIEFYKSETGNEWTPGDQAALQNLSGRVSVPLISAGIIKSLIGSAVRVGTFTYCAKTAMQIAAMPELGDGKAYIVDLWRRYERNKESIQRKQRGH